jgi:hypothetical protein
VLKRQENTQFVSHDQQRVKRHVKSKECSIVRMPETLSTSMALPSTAVHCLYLFTCQRFDSRRNRVCSCIGNHTLNKRFMTSEVLLIQSNPSPELPALLRFTLSLRHLSIRNAVNLNGNRVFTAVAESIVESRATRSLVRHATIATLCRGNTVGLVRLIAQVETGRPDIAIYHASHVSDILFE